MTDLPVRWGMEDLRNGGGGGGGGGGPWNGGGCWGGGGGGTVSITINDTPPPL